MTRVKRAVSQKRRHRKILKLAKGYKGARKSAFRQAKQAVIKAGQYRYRDRRLKKRDFRRLWIVQLNAAARLHGLRYQQLIAGLSKAQIKLNRKVLAALAQEAPAEFGKIIEKIKIALASKN